MGRPVNPNSERSIAARLTVELGWAVNRKHVQEWIAKGYDLTDAVELKKKVRNHQRTPKETVSKRELKSPDIQSPEREKTKEEIDVEKELKKLQDELLASEFYDTTKNTRMKIAGLRDILKSLREQGVYVTEESQTRDAMAMGELIKSLILKIPSDLPQQIIGLCYADAVSKCEDYAYAILTSLAESRNGNRDK